MEMLRIAFALCALLALGLSPMQSKAEDANSRVRVALLDMSAVFSGGRGYTQGWPNTAGPTGQSGRGMMGYGMMRAPARWATA